MMEIENQVPNPRSQEDRDFVRMLFRNRRNIASILRGVPPAWGGIDSPAEAMMNAIEGEWERGDRDD